MSKFIENLQKRIEKNSVKINGVVWENTHGKTHKEDILIKRSRLPLVGDWARIYPVIDENGKPLWLNVIFGGRRNFIKLLLMFGLLTLAFLAFKNIFVQYEALRLACEPFLSNVLVFP
jgi:hypothetical protein